MNTAKITLLPVLALSLLWTTPSFAGNEEFKTKFHNSSGIRINVKIFHSGEKLQKHEKIQPGASHTFDFGQKCSVDHTRLFEIHELQNDTLIGDGKFTMHTGKNRQIAGKDRCRNLSFTFKDCDDLISNDGFKVSCNVNGRNRGDIFIETVTTP